ncbi:unnamed protein product [Debaryomyces tyrocola]|nr:unnamed protein product [Debaryomyces tyrocola]
MNYTKNEGYSQVPLNGNQFVVQNISNLAYPIVTDGANGNVMQTRNSQPNIETRIPNQAEESNSMEAETIGNGNISMTDVNNGGDAVGVPSRSHVFEFHDPFDINSYPITNPPIFDTTMMLPYTTNEGIPRRRRISISNGQIGQIINHEFYLENESPLDDELNGTRPTNQQVSKDDTVLNDVSTHQNRNPVRTGPAGQSVLHQHPQLPPKELVSQPQLKVDHDILREQQQGSVIKNELKSESPKIQIGGSAPAAGVPPPNHQLIYNNEVIYNPNNGPIPGTAAWKKERLLERNRLAASKCRQRKKHAQQQLQNNVSKYQKDVDLLKDKLDKYGTVFKNFNLIISKHADKFPDSDLKLLASFKDIDAITDRDLETISKIADS